MSTKLTRLGLVQFGSAVNGAAEVGEYGSGALGAPVYTASITLMQSLAAWGRGWAAETIANNRPFLEDMNAVDCVFGYNLCYLYQAGIPEFDTSATTVYFLNSIAQYSGLLYQVINDNGGAGISATLPTNTTYWGGANHFITKLYGSWSATYNANTAFQAASDGIVTAWMTNGGANKSVLIGYTDGNSSPSTIRQYTAEDTISGFEYVNICFPVRKGDYWEVNVGGGGNTFDIYFLPLGS